MKELQKYYAEACHLGKHRDFCDNRVVYLASEADAAFAAEIAPLIKARKLVRNQANDDGLWFSARTAAEAYLQQELRRLHSIIEG